MKIKLDENLTVKLTLPLQELGHGVETVIQENLAGKSDFGILSVASPENHFLETLDLDRSDIR